MKLYRELEPGEKESKTDLILNHHSFPNLGHGNWKVFRLIAASEIPEVRQLRAACAKKDEALRASLATFYDKESDLGNQVQSALADDCGKITTPQEEKK